MPDIEPFEFQKSTNIEEHNQMKDKINEMVEVINNIDLENLPSQISALETEVATQGNEIDALEVTVNAIPNTYAKKTDIPDVSDFITDDALTPYAKIVDVDNADISGIDASIANGEITIKLTRPEGDMSDSIDCPFIQTATLIPTSTARAFKIRFTYTDGTQYDTNEFVIPEGGGTDVSVTGVTVGDGTAPNSFKVTIQLSDTTTIGSNDYVIEFPENIDTYPTTLTGSLSGTTLTLTIGLNDGSSVQGTVNLGALLTGYATTSYVDTQVATKLDKATADGYYQPKGNYLTEIPIASASILGGVKIGNGVSVGSDGTISVKASGNVTIEELDISNLPTDFTVNDYIIINVFNMAQQGIRCNPQEWENGVLSVDDNISVSNVPRYTILHSLSGASEGVMNVSGNVLSYIPMYIYEINPIDAWNNTDSNQKLIEINCVIFNGKSKMRTNINITKANIQNYVAKIVRIRYE